MTGEGSGSGGGSGGGGGGGGGGGPWEWDLRLTVADATGEAPLVARGAAAAVLLGGGLPAGDLRGEAAAQAVLQCTLDALTNDVEMPRCRCRPAFPAISP